MHWRPHGKLAREFRGTERTVVSLRLSAMSIVSDTMACLAFDGSSVCITLEHYPLTCRHAVWAAALLHYPGPAWIAPPLRDGPGCAVIAIQSILISSRIWGDELTRTGSPGCQATTWHLGARP